MQKKLDAGGRFVNPKSLQFMKQQDALLPITEAQQVALPRVNIEVALPENVRQLRFNQEQVAKRFGRFKDFLRKYEDKIAYNKRADIARIRQAHYEKYGSSSDDEELKDPEDEEARGSANKQRSINVSIAQDNEPGEIEEPTEQEFDITEPDKEQAQAAV